MSETKKADVVFVLYTAAAGKELEAEAAKKSALVAVADAEVTEEGDRYLLKGTEMNLETGEPEGEITIDAPRALTVIYWEYPDDES